MAIDPEYEQAKKRALERMKKAVNLGFVKLRARDELHDRAQLMKEREADPYLENEKKPTE